MLVRIADGQVEDVKLNIYEPPRFFEAFLRGRAFTEAPDITARICGICPVAYQMSSVQAMEQACGVEVDGQLRALRRLLYCGEWIESHALHVFMLHAPDFLGYESAIELARDMPELVATALAAEEDRQRADDGRRRARGAPDQRARRRLVPRAAQARAAPLVEKLERAREIALEAVRIASGFDFPDYEQDYELVALDEPGEYPIDRGRIVSNRGLDIAGRGVRRALRRGARRLVERAPLAARRARLVPLRPARALRALVDRLSPLAREAAKEVGLDASERNPFRSIVVRSVELVYAADEALRLIAEYEEPDAPPSRSSRGQVSATAAARRRAASSTTATRSTTRARSSTRRSCRRPRRTSGRSRRICAASSSARSTSPTRSWRSSASRRSATTTPASRARPTS